MSGRLAGKATLITATAQGIGRATAIAFAEEIAALAVYPAWDESAFMTGEAVVIDGGCSV